jgi:hypothetical protein
MGEVVAGKFDSEISIGDMRAIALHRWAVDHPRATPAEIKAEMERLRQMMPAPEDKGA